MTTTIIVDDTDPGIRYSGDWAITGSVAPGSNEYNDTIHQGNSNDLKLSYEFNGTRIFVFGTVDAPVSKGMANATYSLDNLPSTGMNGADLSTITDIQSHIRLYQSPVLQNGRHTLNISLSNANSTSPKYFFDFFTIEVQSVPSTADVIVDDRDSSIKYSGDWTDSSSFNEYMYTDREAPDSGNANATFVFNGTAISVYGTIPANADPLSVIEFSIDSGPSTTYTAPVVTSLFGRHTLLYSISSLSQGPHNLIINAVNSTHWWLDYLIYTPTSDASSSSTTPRTSTGGASSSGNSVPTGAIAGGVIGGVLGLVLVGGIIYFLTRKWRREREVSCAKVPEDKQFRSSTTVPNTADSRGILSDRSYAPSTTGTGMTAVGGGIIYRDSKGVYQRSPATPDRVSTIVSDTIPSTLGPPQPTVAPRREVDGGIRLAGSSDHSSGMALSTLPPVYDQY